MKKLKYIALLAALLVGFGMYQFLQELNKPVEIPKTQVIVAVTDIDENVPITEEMVAVKEVVTEAKHPDCETNIENVIGMVLESKVYTGEQILSSKLVAVGENVSTRALSYKIVPGMRAISVNVGISTGMANMIRSGDRVDVILNYRHIADKKSQDGQEREIGGSKLCIQNILGLAVDDIINKEKPEEGYSTVTLMVTPDDAELISYAEFNAGLRLILRSPMDTEIVDTEEINYDTVRSVVEEAEVTEETGEQP